MTDRHYGKYRATVVDNVDPLGRGRIRVSIPSLPGPSTFAWADPVLPVASGASKAIVPAPGQSVLVEFLEGNMEAPLWTGVFVAPDQVSADTGATLDIAIDPETGEKVISDANGNSIAFSASGLKLGDANGNVVILSQEGIEIRAGRVLVESENVMLGGEDGQPPLLGRDMLAIYNTHAHPANGIGPAVPPLTPSVLCRRVTMK